MSIAVKSTCAPESSFVSKLVVVAIGGDAEGGGGEGPGGGGEGPGGGGEGEGGGGEGPGGGGDAEGGGCEGPGGGGEGGAWEAATAVPIVTEGVPSIAMPSAFEAAVVVPRVEAREVCIAATVVDSGTAIVAVMITLPGAMAMVTSAVSTPAAVATLRRSVSVEVSGKSSMLPLAVSVTTMLAVEGGEGDAGGRGGEGTPQTSS